MKKTIDRSLSVLSIKNHWGSVEHYYHFMFGFLIPLEKYLHEQSDPNANLIIRSCGPLMDSIMNDLFPQKFTILPPDEHKKLLQCTNPDNITELRGMDHPKLYSLEIITGFSSRIIRRLKQDIEEKLYNKKNHPGKPCIIVVDRGMPHQFYLSEKSEKPDASIQRRSVPNMYDIYKEIESKQQDTHYVQMEDISIKEQIITFRGADIIIAQHGAALSNLIWCRANTKIIEIIPLAKFFSPSFFKSISVLLNLHHQNILQIRNHSKISPKIILKAIKALDISK